MIKPWGGVMKKLMAIVILFVTFVSLQADRAAGAFFGGLAGGMVGSSIANAGTHRSGRREVDELRREQQQKELDQIRREQAAGRQEHERRMLESKIDNSSYHGNLMLYGLWMIVVILLIAIIGLAVVVLRKK